MWSIESWKGTIHKESAVFAMTISGFVLSCGALGKPKPQWSCYLLVSCLVSRVEASTTVFVLSHSEAFRSLVFLST